MEGKGEGGVTRTTASTWVHKGWDIDYFGNGYRMTRREKVDGKTETLTAGSLAKAAMLIDRAESDIKSVGHIVRGRK